MSALLRRLVTATIVSTALVASLGGPVHAETVQTLPLPAASDVVTAGSRVFVSGGSGSSQIVVTSPDGTVQKTIGSLGGPTRLLASADGTTVYAALTTGNAVAAISVRTLRVISTYSTGADTCPTSLAQSGRWLYFGYGCTPGQWNSGLGRIDLFKRQAAAFRVNGEAYYSAPLLTASGSVLAAGQPDLSPTTVTSYRVSRNGSLTQMSRSDVTQSDLGSNLSDLAITRSGAEVFTAAGYPYSILQYATADLTVQLKSYLTAPYPTAVALSADGTVLAGGSDARFDPDVYLFKNGVPTENFELNAPLIPGGLAWGRDNSHLYAVTYDPWVSPPAPPVLHVLTPTG